MSDIIAAEHPDWKEIVTDSKFHAWADRQEGETKRQYESKATGDAIKLLTTYKNFKSGSASRDSDKTVIFRRHLPDEGFKASEGDRIQVSGGNSQDSGGFVELQSKNFDPSDFVFRSPTNDVLVYDSSVDVKIDKPQKPEIEAWNTLREVLERRSKLMQEMIDNAILSGNIGPVGHKKSYKIRGANTAMIERDEDGVITQEEVDTMLTPKREKSWLDNLSVMAPMSHKMGMG